MNAGPQTPVPGSGTERSATPFWITLAVMGILTLALFRLPESFVVQLERDRPLSSGQAGWAYRLLALAAAAQAAYVGFVLLRPERVERARTQENRMARMTKGELVASAGRNAAAMAGLTLVYGLSAFAITGQRGGYWLFFLLALAQLAWYFRLVGEIEAWLGFQPEFVSRLDSGLMRGSTGNSAEEEAPDVSGPT